MTDRAIARALGVSDKTIAGPDPGYSGDGGSCSGSCS
jgi:hypothetical protein